MDSANRDNQTMICNICGVRKPLSDFSLSFSHHIKKYGQICNNCRTRANNAWKNNFFHQEEEDDGSGGGKQNQRRIDANYKNAVLKQGQSLQNKTEEAKREYREEKILGRPKSSLFKTIKSNLSSSKSTSNSPNTNAPSTRKTR